MPEGPYWERTDQVEGRTLITSIKEWRSGMFTISVRDEHGVVVPMRRLRLRLALQLFQDPEYGFVRVH